MNELIKEFFYQVENEDVEIYNEFSLQHEFGIFLRKKFSDFKIQFERNVSSFGFKKDKLYKKEIDLVMYKPNNWQSAIEFKFPRNGQVPESMFSFCKDIAFLEQLLHLGFKSAYFIAVVEDSKFYSAEFSNLSGIYGYFRNKHPITGKIVKPTGNKNDDVRINNTYIVEWNSIRGDMKYCAIEITHKLLTYE